MVFSNFCTWLPRAGASVCSQSCLRPSVLLRRHHHRSQPNLWCHHRHVCRLEKWKAKEGGDPENHLFYLRCVFVQSTRGVQTWSARTEFGHPDAKTHNSTLQLSCCCPCRAGKGQIWQQDSDFWGAYKIRTQYVALPLFLGSGEGEGSNWIHWTWELRSPDDCGQ